MGQDGLGDSWQGGQAQGGGLSGSVSGSFAHLQPLIRVCWGNEMWIHVRPRVSGVALVITHFLLQLRAAVTASKRGR